MGDRGKTRDELIGGLMAAAGEKLPTSSLGRLGRGAMAALRGGRMVLSSSRRDGGFDDLDPAKVARLVTSLGRLKGVAMKMGQIMSYIDVALPEELRDALAVLQTHAQPMPFDKVRRLVLEELPESGERLLAGMEPEPLAAASIGQVHRAVLPGGAVAAVKVQYPEVAAAIEADFGPAAVGTKIASLFYPGARIDDLVKEARARFLEETDYLHEAFCQQRFAELYRDHEVLSVPDVHREFCSRRVLTSRFVDGLSFDAFLDTAPDPARRDRVGVALFEFYLGSLFRHGLYNCDPHPGNYLFPEDGRVAMLDHGCTREFDTAFVARLANLTRAVHRDDPDALHHALLGLGIVREGKRYDRGMIRGLLRGFYGPMLDDRERAVDLSEAMAMREMARKKRQLLEFSLPGEFVFLLRIRFGLLSVLSRLGARANWFRLERRFVDDFAAANPILCN